MHRLFLLQRRRVYLNLCLPIHRCLWKAIPMMMVTDLARLDFLMRTKKQKVIMIPT